MDNYKVSICEKFHHNKIKMLVWLFFKIRSVLWNGEELTFFLVFTISQLTLVFIYIHIMIRKTFYWIK